MVVALAEGTSKAEHKGLAFKSKPSERYSFICIIYGLSVDVELNGMFGDFGDQIGEGCSLWQVDR